MIELTIQYDPTKEWVMGSLKPIAYLQLERFEDAKASAKPYIESGFTLAQYMWGTPEFQDKEQFADYLSKTGFTGDYYKIRQMKKLTDKEIKKQILDSNIDGHESEYGSVISFKSNGDTIYQWGDKSDQIDVYEKNQMFCIQWNNLYGGLEDCSYVYENQEGSAESKNEYIRASDYGSIGFSVIK